MRTEHRVALRVGLDTALDEIRRVPGEPQLLGPDRLDNVEAPVRSVAVDVLLVLVQEHHIVSTGPLGKGGHAPQDLVAVRRRFVAFREEEGENPDVGSLESFGDVQGAVEPAQMVIEVVVHADLTDRRAHR